MDSKQAKMTMYFYKVTRTCSSWEKAFYELYEASDEINKGKLWKVYPELCEAWDLWFKQGDSYFKEFRR